MTRAGSRTSTTSAGSSSAISSRSASASRVESWASAAGWLSSGTDSPSSLGSLSINPLERVKSE